MGEHVAGNSSGLMGKKREKGKAFVHDAHYVHDAWGEAAPGIRLIFGRLLCFEGFMIDRQETSQENNIFSWGKSALATPNIAFSVNTSPMPPGLFIQV